MGEREAISTELEADIVRIAELNAVLTNVLGSFGRAIKKVGYDTECLKGDLGSLLSERAQEKAQREQPAMKALEDIGNRLPADGQNKELFDSLADLVRGLDSKIESVNSCASVLATKVDTAESSSRADITLLRDSLNELAVAFRKTDAYAPSSPDDSRGRKRAHRIRAVKGRSSEPSVTDTIAEPLHVEDAAEGGNVSENELGSVEILSPANPVSSDLVVEARHDLDTAAAPRIDTPLELETSLEEGIQGATVDSRDSNGAFLGTADGYVSSEALGGAGAGRPDEDAHVLDSLQQAMRDIRSSSSHRQEQANARFRDPAMPGDPLLRHLSRSLDLYGSQDSDNDDEHDDANRVEGQLVLVTAALVSRTVALEQTVAQRLEPRIASSSKALVGVERTVEGLTEQVAGLTSVVDSLRSTVETLEQRVLVLAQDGAPGSPAISSPMTTPQRAMRKEREPVDAATALATNLNNNLAKARELWSRVCTEIGQALHAFHKHSKYFLELEAREAAETGTRTLMQDLELMHEQTDVLLRLLSPLGDPKPAEILLSAHGLLDQVTQGFDAVLARNEALRQQAGAAGDSSLANIVTLADLWSRFPDLSRHITEATAVSVYLLDYNIDKVRLRRSIQAIEERLESLAAKQEVLDLKEDLAAQMALKSNQRDVETQLNKKASLSEVWKFREAIFKQLDAIKVAMKSGNSLVDSIHEDSQDNEYVGDIQRVDSQDRRLSKGSELLSRRFEILNDHFGRMMEVLDTLVARKELEDALLTVMGEVKQLKAAIVEPVHLREKLAQKANVDDLNKLVRALEKALGGRLDGVGEAAAVQIKCLVCDHPVSSATRSPLSHYCKPSSPFFERGGSPETSISRRGQRSPEADGLSEERRRDMQVLTHTIDLPPVNPGSAAEKYKARVRSSAGGGVATNITMDTR